MLAFLALLQLQTATTVASPGDSLPTVTLTEALRRATGLDPNYVAALGQVDNAVWARRSAFAVFIVPSVTLATQATQYNPGFFNIANPSKPAKNVVTAQAVLQYDVFTGGQKVAELTRSAAALDGAQAGELRARFAAAQATESTYYAVLANEELTRVARERVQRAEQQLSVARARVTTGAVVQTDSLQLRLELSRARVGLLQQETGLRVARLTLGSRIGADGPVEAAPLDSVLPPELPVSFASAVEEAALQGPQYRQARANERATAAAFRAQLGAYLPHATLSFTPTAYDEVFMPTGFKVSALALSVSFPLWDNGHREIAVSQARVNHDIARTTREQMERSVRRDVAAAYDGFTTARASAELAGEGLRVASENFRVQQSRYRAGASTILDLLKAQSDLDDADATLVQARYAARLALAGLETILGRRLFPEPQQK
jgi:outer membrane protein TolC